MAPDDWGMARLIGRRMRRRLIWTFLAFGIGAGSTFYYNAAVFGFLLAPAGDNLSPFDGQPVFNSPVDMMGATISLAIRGGAVLALPVLVCMLESAVVCPVLASNAGGQQPTGW